MFKVGDLVVLKSTDALFKAENHRGEDNPHYPVIGEPLTVKGVERFPHATIYWFVEKPNGAYEADLEFQAIVDSPLYKALL